MSQRRDADDDDITWFLSKMTMAVGHWPLVLLRIVAEYVVDSTGLVPGLAKLELHGNGWKTLGCRDPNFRPLSWSVVPHWNTATQDNTITVTVESDDDLDHYWVATGAVRIRIIRIDQTAVRIPPASKTSTARAGAGAGCFGASAGSAPAKMDDEAFHTVGGGHNAASWIFANVNCRPHDALVLEIAHVTTPRLAYHAPS